MPKACEVWGDHLTLSKHKYTPKTDIERQVAPRGLFPADQSAWNAMPLGRVQNSRRQTIRVG